MRAGGLFGKLIEPGVFFMECLLKTKLIVRKGCMVGFCTRKLMPIEVFITLRRPLRNSSYEGIRGNYGICKVFALHKK